MRLQLQRSFGTRFVVLILALAFLLPILAACGGSSTPTTNAVPTATVASTATPVPSTVLRVTSTPTNTATPTGTVAATITTVVAEGQQLYKADCASCHGANGEGGLKLGEATAANIGFAALNDMYKGDWSLAKRSILDGLDEEGKTLDPTMPRWRGKLSEQDVANIIAFLKTLP